MRNFYNVLLISVKEGFTVSGADYFFQTGRILRLIRLQLLFQEMLRFSLNQQHAEILSNRSRLIMKIRLILGSNMDSFELNLIAL